MMNIGHLPVFIDEKKKEQSKVCILIGYGIYTFLRRGGRRTGQTPFLTWDWGYRPCYLGGLKNSARVATGQEGQR